MHRFPLIVYTLMAAAFFLVGMRQLHLYEGPTGTGGHLASAILLLAMASGVIYSGLILKDDWQAQSKKDVAQPKGPLLPVKKDQDA